MNEETLRSITDRAKAGDKEAFTELYEATNPEIYHTILSMIRSEDQALDIQQEVYVHAFTHLNQLGDSGKLLPWLRAIAVNRCRTALRKQTPVLFTELEREDDSGIPELTDVRPGSLPEEALEQKERSRLIRETLDTLTDSQRLLVGMYYYEQLPISKIAEDLNLSPGTVKTQLSRSRKKLESRIKWLEARGAKLFGLAPMPFLMSLLRLQKPTAVGEEKALAGALSEAGISAESDAIHVGRRFFETALGKAVLGVAAVAAIGVGVAGWSWYQNRNQGNVGDVQTPETVHMAVYEDSDEDLHTAPETDPDPETDTVYLTLPDSEEDLPPEPETDLTEPTKPEPDTEEPTDPPTPPDPVIQSRDPDPGPGALLPDGTLAGMPGSEGTGVQPVAAGGTEAPSEETPEQNADQEPGAVLYWRWAVDDGAGGYFEEVGADWYVDLNVYLRRGKILVVSVEGDAVPRIVTDRPEIINIGYWGEFTGITTSYRPPDGVTEYKWTVNPCGVGTAHVYCVLNGEITHTVTVHVPEVPIRYQSTYVTIDDYPGYRDFPDLKDCSVGTVFTINAYVQGTMQPEIYTDAPVIVRLKELTAAPNGWDSTGFSVQGEIIGAGEAHIYVKLNGEIEDVITVHSTEEIIFEDESAEDLPLP